MTLSDIRRRAREQTGDQYSIDAGDDALLNDYINEGNAALYGEYRPEGLERLVGDADESGLPELHHGALADYASWRMLSNCGSGAQQRAQYYYMRFQLACVQVSRHFERRAQLRRLRNKF